MSIHVLSISLLHMYRHYIQANSQWHPKDADARWYLIAQNVLRKPPEACASPPERPEGFRASIQVLPKHVSALNWADLAELTSVSCRINKAGFWAVLYTYYTYYYHSILMQTYIHFKVDLTVKHDRQVHVGSHIWVIAYVWPYIQVCLSCFSGYISTW